MKKLQRPLFELINLFLALLFVLPIGAFLEAAFGFPLYRTCFLLCLSGLGFLAGRAALCASIEVSMAACGGAAAAAGVLTALLMPPATSFVLTVFVLLAVFLSFFFFFGARKAGYTVYTPLAVTGILIHLFLLLAANWLNLRVATVSLMSTCAMTYFLLCLYTFNAKGLRMSLHKGSGVKSVRYPVGMQLDNFLLITGFILLAILVSNISVIFQGFSAVFTALINVIFAGIHALSSLYDDPNRVLAEESSASPSPVADGDNLMKYDPKGEASWVTQMVYIIAFICVAVLVVYSLYKLYRYLRGKGGRFAKLLNRLRGAFAPPVIQDYEEETESLFSWKTVLDDAKQNIQTRIKKLTTRPQKIDDFPDDRMKIRFVYQTLLKRLQGRLPTVTAMTPNELRTNAEVGQELNEFLDVYNAVRYDGQAPSAEDVAAARQILKE